MTVGAHQDDRGGGSGGRANGHPQQSVSEAEGPVLNGAKGFPYPSSRHCDGANPGGGPERHIEWRDHSCHAGMRVE